MIVDSFSHQATNVPKTISRGNAFVEPKTLAKDRNTGIRAWSIVLLNTTLAPAYIQVFYKIDSKVNVGTDVPDVVIPVAAGANLVLPIDDKGFLIGDAVNGCSVAGTTQRGNSVSAPIDVLILFN